jgi:hypothetical protein
MTATRTQTHSAFSAKEVKALTNFVPQSLQDVKDLAQIGIGLDTRFLAHAAQAYRNAGHGMDAGPNPLVTTASIAVPIQFLQSWLPGFVKVITAARKIDEITGIRIAGRWEDEQVIQGILERTGTALVYGDINNVPLSNWNVNWVRRTVVRFEQGMMVGRLAEARSALANISDSDMKREAAALSLDIARNNVGFLGFNNGVNNTYGFLNDPNLPGYVTVPNGAAGSPLWSTKTFLEIVKDIRTAIVALRTQSQDTIDPENIELTLVLPTNSVDYLSVTSDFGNSVREWMEETYPRIRVVSAPQLNAANGMANVFYLFAEVVNDNSTDGGRTFDQIVPTRFMLLGVEQTAKGYIEDYSNATAGIMNTRPWAIVRYSGI